MRAWIVEVATRTADPPTAAIGWGPRVALAVLTVLVAGVVVVGPVPLRRPITGLACCGGWSRRCWCGCRRRAGCPGWVLVACDVGQGDALVLPPVRTQR